MTSTALNRRLSTDLDNTFTGFMAEMQGAVFNGARRWLPTRQDAEDVTQEVFVRAYMALQGYPPEQIAGLRLRPWLFAITLNLCRNQARARSRRPVQVALGHTDDAAPDGTEQSAIDGLAVDEWRRRLTRLTGRQRDAIVLRHVVEMSYQEISEVLGRPAGTVKSDVHRGLERLRAIIDSEELS
ncbi:MAG: RNA polymerase sigma factor [Acidimicrobiia bacterium]